MSGIKQNLTPLTALVAVLVVCVAVLGYMVYQTNSQLDALAATYQADAAPPAHADTDDAIIPKQQAEANDNDPWALLDKQFDPGAWNPFKEMDAMHKRIDAMFDRAFRRFGQSPQRHDMRKGTITPRMDLEEENGQYVVRLDMPGAQDSDIDVTLEGNVLTVEALIRLEEKREEEGRVLQRERRMGRFLRKIDLPEPVDIDSMQTSYKDGVFTVTIRKAGKVSEEQS
ncbi:MAG: Hsp20/alpha crystallin family protein [Candidatus Hydrogenedentota bacterium]